MKDAAVIKPALGYLLQRQHADGGFSATPSSPLSVYLTSRVLLLLQHHLFEYKLSGPLQACIDYLYRQDHSNGWGQAWERAQALIALIPVTIDSSRYAEAVADLRDHQEAGGSWVGSVYATALSMRALHLAERREAPVEPATGSVTGRMLDGATGLPLAGGLVTLPGTALETLTSVSGRFDLSNIPPGHHSVELAFPGYGSALRQLHMEPGNQLDMGTVVLQPLVDTGLLQGTVIDGVSGIPVVGALVEVSGAEQIAVTTDTNGHYRITLPTGAVAITVTADGYEPVSASATVVAGAVLHFSPVLHAIGAEPESTLTLRGRVLDAVDHFPIPGALISADLAETLTCTTGSFLLEGLAPAELTLVIQADGYQTVQLSILAEHGGLFDLGDLRLVEYREPPSDPTTGTMRGRMQDGATGLPLAGGTVILHGSDHQTLTGADGGFEFSGIEPGDYVAELGFPGYDSVLLQVHLEAGRRLDIGTVILQPLPDFGLIQGTVTDGVSGVAVAGALVEAAGADHASAITGADGSYQIELPAGAVEITVTADGYEPVTASGTLLAGTALRFSPALQPVGTEPEKTLTLGGRILDSVDETPVSGARITSAGVVDTFTGHNGYFLLEELAPADLVLAIHADGYLGVSLSILAEQGGVIDLGDLRLARVEVPRTSTIRGTVRATDDSEPIAGAVLTISDQSTESDDSGYFVIEGVENLSFELSARAPGYFARNYKVDLAEHGTAELAVTLQRAASGGIIITGMTADRPSYPAYSQVRMSAVLKNSADIGREVRLHARVLDSQGGLIEEFGATPEATGGSDRLLVEFGVVEEADLTWFNRHLAPGSYRIWLQVHDAASSELLAERVTHVVVEETRRFEYLRLAPNVSQTNQGSTETLQILLSIRNRSNIPVEPGITYEWRSPEGAILFTDSATAPIDPGTISTTLNLMEFTHHFNRAGHYPFEIIGIEGVAITSMESGAVDVAPDIRIELQQNVTPGIVLPQGDKRLRMKIRIEGVQAP